MKVHILKTCRNPEIKRASELVFETIKIGFPTSEVVVTENADGQVAHGVWIESLINQSEEPFWICDTDIIFHREVESWDFGSRWFAGRYEPEFREPWTNTIHVARLHPSLMWLNPVAIREGIKKWPSKHPFFDTVEKNLIRWQWVPKGGDILFYDTCAGLFLAFTIHSVLFNEVQNRAYTHLHCGTYSDIQPNEHLKTVHKLVMDDPRLAPILLDLQKHWYKEAAC